MASARELGERGIIDLMLSIFHKMPVTPIPPYEDVSAIELENGRLLIAKCDMLVGKTDIPPKMTLRQAARKAVIMNVSDFAAKGVKPLAMLVSVAFPSNFTRDDVELIARGLDDGAREYGIYIIGGDTNEADDIVIDCLLLGIGKKGEIMLRRGAKVDDLLAVTGYFGDTSAGLKILLEGKKAPKEIKNKLLSSVFIPRARLREGLALAKSGVITSSIDSSDGLAWSLYELQKASNVGFLLEKIPISPEAERFAKLCDISPAELALYGGEEFELVLTIKKRRWDVAKDAVRKVGGKLLRIGCVVEEQGIFLKEKDKVVPVEPKGFEHFKR